MNEFIQKLLHEFETPFTNSVLIFSVILFIILLAPILLKRVRIPGIIGLILSGIVIGPHGLNLLEKNSAVDLFSTIGLLYIMFIAGLELDLGEFKKNKNKSFVFGFFTFIIPLALGFPVCFYLLGYAANTSILIASMFATHTLIAYPIVSRLGISKNESVAITVGGTILTDTAVLIILAIISGSEKGGLTNEFWLRLGISLIIFLIIVVLIIPRVASWFFKKQEDEKNAHFIFILSMVFFCAFLAELSGLEPIIGAFAAGLVLNKLIPHTSSLMNRIEFVGSSLFIPFFLISVGMLIDVSVLVKGPQALIVAASLTVVAIAGKWLAAFVTSLVFKYSAHQRQLIFGLSSAHAAATLAVILVGYKIGILDDNVLNGTIVLILVTCIVASFVTEAAGKEVVLHEKNEEPELPALTLQRIMVPIANPATMERLIDFAILIKEQKNFSPIVALSVVDDNDEAQGKLLQARKMLEKAMTHAAAADQTIEIIATIDRNVTNGIQRVAREMFITNIIMGWPGKIKLADYIFGKTFDSIVQHTTQQVFITRFVHPVNIHNNVHIFCPPFAELEEGFVQTLQAVFSISKQLSSTATLYATPKTYAPIQEYLARTKLTVTLTIREFYDLISIPTLQKEFHTDDMIILISARKGSISYTPVLDILPKKMTTAFDDNSLIFIYPQSSSVNATGYLEEPDGNLLEKGIDMLKTATNIFRK